MWNELFCKFLSCFSFDYINQLVKNNFLKPHIVTAISIWSGSHLNYSIMNFHKMEWYFSRFTERGSSMDRLLRICKNNYIDIIRGTHTQKNPQLILSQGGTSQMDKSDNCLFSVLATAWCPLPPTHTLTECGKEKCSWEFFYKVLKW